MAKIAVIMFYTKGYSLGNYTHKINELYCKTNNYDFYVYHDIPEPLKNRHSSWCKQYYLEKHMNDLHDYIMWIDADAFFCNTSIRIEKWIEQSENKDYIICRDAGYSLPKFETDLKGRNTIPLLNSGVIIMKNTENNKLILNHILYNPLYTPNYNKRRSKNQTTKLIGWDQAAVRHTYLKNVHNMKENTWIIRDTNFNNNCTDLDDYIDQGGYIIHLTNFKCRFKIGRFSMITIKKYIEKYLPEDG